MADNIIVQRLREARRQKGATQEVTAEACGISHVSLARYETGARTPRIEIATRLAQFYGVSVDYLMGAERAPADPPPEEIDSAIARLGGGLSPEEVQRVLDFIAGIKAARKG